MAKPTPELTADLPDLEPGARRGLLNWSKRMWGVNNVPDVEAFYKALTHLLEVYDGEGPVLFDIGPISRAQALRIADNLKRTGDVVREVSEDAARFLHGMAGALYESVKKDIDARTTDLEF